jgi:hypothetical protein
MITGVVKSGEGEPPVDESELSQKLLREALVVLSLPPDEQVRVNGPGCLACDLLNDFDHARSVAFGDAAALLSAEQRRLLDCILALVRSMQEADFECFNEEVVRRPGWQQLRLLASQALRAFNWEDSSVEPYAEVEPGVWRRPPANTK